MADLFYRPEPEYRPTEQELLGRLLRMGGAEEIQPTYGDFGPTEEVGRFQPGEAVKMMNGSLGGKIVAGPTRSYEGPAYWVDVFDHEGPRGVELWDEKLLRRPDRYDQPGESTLEDWFGIPPEGEEYFRTAMIKDIGSPNSESYGEWFKPVEPHVNEEAKYFHQCPACGGYMQKRGEDIYECTQCPNSILPERYAANQVMYHISPPFNRESIQQHGIDYSKADPRGRLWGAGEHWPDGNYLFTSYDQADMDPEDDIWEVNVDGLDLQPDPYEGLDNPDARLTADPITPDRLRLVRPGEYDGGPWWEKTATDNLWNQMLQPGYVDPLEGKRAFAFIHSPGEGWIRWSGPSGPHSEIEEEIYHAGERTPDDAVYGRWYPNGGQGVKGAVPPGHVEIYDGRLDDQQKELIANLARLNAPDH